jgi:hypothetical protein
MSWANAYLEKRLHYVARRITHFDLQQPELGSWDFSEADLEDSLADRERGRRDGQLFMGFYSRLGLETALERYGTLDRLRHRGFKPWLSFHHMGDQRDILHLKDGENGPILIELVCRYLTLQAKATRSTIQMGDSIELLAVEWILMQDPYRPFENQRLPFPGQQHPGLGLGREVTVLLQIMTERLGKEGMLVVPAYYHNGVLYNESFHFFSPEKEGELRALERDLAQFPIAIASWAVEKGLVCDEHTGQPFVWHPEEMLWPFSTRLKDYFATTTYHDAVAQIMQQQRFTLIGDPYQLVPLVTPLF